MSKNGFLLCIPYTNCRNQRFAFANLPCGGHGHIIYREIPFYIGCIIFMRKSGAAGRMASYYLQLVIGSFESHMRMGAKEQEKFERSEENKLMTAERAGVIFRATGS